MGWILLEALVALLLAVGIVWWTMGPKTPQASAGRPTARRADAASMQHARHRQREHRDRRVERVPSSATIW